MTVTRLSDAQFEAICSHLNAIVGAIEEHSKNTGKWLAVVAAKDDLGEIQEEIKKLKAARQELQKAEEKDGESGT